LYSSLLLSPPFPTRRSSDLLSSTRRLEAELSMRLRFDEVGNGRGTPQHMKLRYTARNALLEWSDAAPAGAGETPLLVSPVPRRRSEEHTLNSSHVSISYAVF